MGNQQSGGHLHAGGGGKHDHHPHDAVLESMQKEADRDAHLANLDHSSSSQGGGFKRGKSLRKSISKRILRRQSKSSSKNLEDGPPPEPDPHQATEPLEAEPVASPAARDLPDTGSASTAPTQASSDPAVDRTTVVTTVLTLPPPSSTSTQPSASTSSPSLEKLRERPSEQQQPPSLKSTHSSSSSSKKLTAGEPQPFPTHIQESTSSSHLRMDKLRQSFRKSLRKKKSGSGLDGGGGPQNGEGGSSKGGSGGQGAWQSDEVNVRSGNCSFHVKYLGSVEVFESRGMQVCEEAIKVLKTSKRKSVRAVLHVSGDGLRVVDDETRGLVVDQTIEKVSFCAPDRNYERGFSYICRDGTTRRWMCHGFFAVKESGERLSHAVGCAFAVCLERKQKRDKDCAVSMNFDNKNSTFTRLGSFRQATITERLQDPQMLKPSPPKPSPTPNASSMLTPTNDSVEKRLSADSSNASESGGNATTAERNPFAIARPHATDLMFQRQASFRGFGKAGALNGGPGNKLTENSPFKRQLSLRISDLPSTVERIQSNSSQGNSNNNKRSASSVVSPPPSSFDSSTTTSGAPKPKPGSHLEELSTLVISHTNEAAEGFNSLFNSPEFDKQSKPTPFTSPRISFNPLQTVPENQLLFNNQQHSSSSLAHSIITPSKASTVTTPENNNYHNSSSSSQTNHHQFNSLPFDPLMTSSMSIKEEEENEELENQNKVTTSLFNDFRQHPSSSASNKTEDSRPTLKSEPTPAAAPPVTPKQLSYDVWDLVPGQTNLSGSSAGGGNNNTSVGGQTLNCDSSSGISSTSSNYGGGAKTQGQGLGATPGGGPITGKQAQSDYDALLDSSVNWLDQVSELIKSDNKGQKPAPVDLAPVSTAGALLEDPFDADWAALATRSTHHQDNSGKNPFRSSNGGDGSSQGASNYGAVTAKNEVTIQQAFELQM